jgi:hypothetical protein
VKDLWTLELPFAEDDEEADAEEEVNILLLSLENCLTPDVTCCRDREI